MGRSRMGDKGQWPWARSTHGGGARERRKVKGHPRLSTGLGQLDAPANKGQDHRHVFAKAACGPGPRYGIECQAVRQARGQ